jgi:L-ribulose-5-phosphate 4-epimerase
MLLKDLRKQVYKANMDLLKYGLVKFTWGNVSAIDRQKRLFIIKPSGIEYSELSYKNLVILNLQGEIVEGDLKPSSDTDTHLVLYQNFKDISSIVHTHSPWAVSFAQAGIDIPSAGTTHADTFYGDIPVTRKMKENEVETDYERQTGEVIIETFNKRKINPSQIPAVLVNDHGPFIWGADANKAVYNSVVLEEVAQMAYHTISLNKQKVGIDKFLLDKHFLRKHGLNAYYGQKDK